MLPETKAPRSLWLLPVIAGLLAGLSACGSASQPAPARVPSSPSRPRVLSDLSSLSAASASEPGQGEFRGVPPATAGTVEARPGTVSQSDAPDLRRLFLEGPGSGRFAGSAAAPGEERLLNLKAEQFPQFSSSLLHQVFIAAQQLEHGEISRQSLRDGLKPAVVTAIMNKDGRLKELILEQRSGSAAVDKLMIEACKYGLRTSNPPSAAMAQDGTYRMQVEGRLKNFNTMDGVHWNFETRLGFTLL